MLFKKEEFNLPKQGGYFPETNLNKNFQMVRIPVSVYININETQHSFEWVSHCIDALQVRTKCTVGLWLQMWPLFSTMWNTGFCSKRTHALLQNIIENKFSTAWLTYYRAAAVHGGSLKPRHSQVINIASCKGSCALPPQSSQGTYSEYYLAAPTSQLLHRMEPR